MTNRTEFSSPVNCKELAMWNLEAERRGQAASNDSLPMTFWKVAERWPLLLGVIRQHFPCLSMDRLRVKSVELVSFMML